MIHFMRGRTKFALFAAVTVLWVTMCLSLWYSISSARDEPITVAILAEDPAEANTEPLLVTIPYVEDVPRPKQIRLADFNDLLAALELSAKNFQCGSKFTVNSTRLQQFLDVDRAPIAIAINLYNNAEILPDMIIQLSKFLDVVKSRVYVAVYENGSSDQSKSHLHLLRLILRARGIAHDIRTSFEHRPESAHRIEYMATVRNQVLDRMSTDPLFALASHIVFMNDVIFCAEDLVEMLRQAHIQDADMTCAMDFDTDAGGLGFYDTWVARNIHGEMLVKRPIDGCTQDDESNRRLRQKLPFPVHCCWNGIAVLRAEAFRGEHGIRFRREFSDPVMNFTDPRLPTAAIDHPEQTWYWTCSASEINQVCRDMDKLGMKRRIMVPRVQVAYDYPTYAAIGLLEKHSIWNPMYDISSEQVNYPERSPETVLCIPMEGSGTRNPDGQVGREIILN